MCRDSPESTNAKGSASAPAERLPIPIWWQMLLHVMIGCAGSYFLVTDAGFDPWPIQLVMFPFFQLGPLVPPLNALVLFVAFVLFVFTLDRAMRKRGYWIIGCHISWAVLWALPALAIRFGEYVGP